MDCQEKNVVILKKLAKRGFFIYNTIMDIQQINAFVGLKIKEERKSLGINQDELAKKIGVGKTTISNYEVGIRSPKKPQLLKLAEVFGISVDDFFPNIETKHSSTKTILDNIFNKLEKPRQEIVINTAQEQLDEQNKENLVQLFSYNVQEKLSAGTGYGYFDDGNSDTVYYNKQYDYDFASWIFGDSMLPDYPNGDVALIKAGPFEYDGCVYAVDWDGQSYIKKVYKEEKGLRLVSTNEKYSDKFAPFTEEPRIIGKVVASFTPLEK